MSRATSVTTTGMQVNDSEANRTPIGRPIADNPQALASAAPAKLNPSTGAQNSAVRPVTVKPVDRRTIQGSYAGDSRAQANSVTMPPTGAPRKQMAGQRDSRSYNEDGSAFVSTANSLDSDAGN
jgi:hypothetical protein